MSRSLIFSLLLAVACTSQDSVLRPGSPLVVHPSGNRDTTVAREPLLIIGAEGDPDYEFFSVRWVGALSDDRILVANTGTRELRSYSPRGELVASAGGQGEGPGEFAVMGAVQVLPGDTIRVDDPLLKRLTTFSPDLRVVSTQGYSELASSLPRNREQICEEPHVIGTDARGDLVSWAWSCRPWQYEGLFTISTPLLVSDPISQDSRTIVDLERVSIYYDANLPNGYFLSVPFTRANEPTLMGESVLVAGGTDFTVRRFGLDGSVLLELRDEMPRRLVPDSVVQRYRTDYATQLDVPVARVPAVPIPDSLPGFTRALAGDDQIWAMHYAAETDANVLWSVYGEAGELLGIASFPAGFALHTVTGGRAYGVLTDPLV